jgi:hypothetical protein
MQLPGHVCDQVVLRREVSQDPHADPIPMTFRRTVRQELRRQVNVRDFARENPSEIPLPFLSEKPAKSRRLK